jgi:hypothetical protein
MRVLVTAASKYGATAEIARMIGYVLAERGVDATVTPPGFPAISWDKPPHSVRIMMPSADTRAALLRRSCRR